VAEQVERLARVVAETTWRDLPPAIQDRARLVFQDTLGVILAGSLEPEVARLTAALAGASGEAMVYGPGFPRADARTAALLNGTAGRSVELCEGHRFASCQAAVQALPTVLAAGEAWGASGEEALMALVLGYEVAARLGLATRPRPGAHQNGQWPLLGAVAAGARLRRFDAAQTYAALRVGAVLVLTPGYSNVLAGGTALNLAGGLAGCVGVLVPNLVEAGFEAQPDAVEESFGRLVGDGFEPAVLLEGLGQRWEIGRNHFRLRGCCNPIYAALDGLDAVLSELQPTPDQIARIDVETYQFASLMAVQEPPNHFAAKYSLPHAAAATVVLGQTGHGAFTAAAVQNEAIAALRRRVFLSEDPAMTAVVPRLKPARVTVTLRDGRQASRLVESARGDFQQPYRPDELSDKFRALAGLVVSSAGVAVAEQIVARLDREPSLAVLPNALRSHPAG
jgi:2-methylcitrate dehydratase PrpD